VRVGGDKLSEAISEYIKKKYSLAIGTQTAEEVKIKIGTALPKKKEQFLDVRGRDLISGLPRNIKVSSNETVQALQEVLKEIISTVKQVLRNTPPELSADVMNKGMIIAGGGSMLRNMDEIIAKATGVPCFRADEPLYCVVKGTGVVIENLDTYKRSIMSKK